MSAPDLWIEPNPADGRMPAALRRFDEDRGCLQRRYATPFSAQRRRRLRDFHAEWRARLQSLPAAGLSRSDQVDRLLFAALLDASDRQIDTEERLLGEIAPLVPFLDRLVDLDAARRDLTDVDPVAAAGALDGALDAIRSLTTRIEAGDSPSVRPAVAFRAARVLDRLLECLKEWHTFYSGYDPLFTWWVEQPYRAIEAAIGEYARLLRSRLAGADSPDAIVGDPIGREALVAELREAFVAYSPEELIDIGRAEADWCLAELRRAAEDMGLSDDWRAAIERAKQTHVAPGRQPALVRDLAAEAIDFVRDHDLVTVPELAAECWRMDMMSAERQKVNPFFLGGETIVVSYPTREMSHKEKWMSLRGNNAAFSRATVQHELIPGHHLQGFAQARHRPERRIFYTPFWTEGWTLGWELLLWDLGFPRTAEERVGMLFWRLHRCIRVVFSLGFHLGRLSPADCVEMLVNEVGHERENAVGEVRRSFGEDYGALYQCAYLIGGLQIHSLRRELTTTGAMTLRGFHDAVLSENCMPIGVLRALLTGRPIDADTCASWRFHPDFP